MWHLIAGKELLRQSYSTLPDLEAVKVWKLKILQNQLFLGIDVSSWAAAVADSSGRIVSLEFEARRLASLRVFHWQADDVVTIKIWKNCGLIWVSLRGTVINLTFSCTVLRLQRVASYRVNQPDYYSSEQGNEYLLKC
jgi:hypothetical protein